MKNPKLIAGFLLLLLMASCGRQSSGWGRSPCELDESLVGQVVSVSGIIEFVDDSLPGVFYADLSTGGCRVGITTNAMEMQSWNADPAAAFVVGADITVTGNLLSVPLPDRPDEFQLMVDLVIDPEVHREGDPAAGEQHQPDGELCTVSGQVGGTVTVSGEISYVDRNAAAGVYAEMQAERGCFYKLWVERRFWDTWSPADQALMVEGNLLEIEGLLTLVLGEQTIDMDTPPLSVAP